MTDIEVANSCQKKKIIDVAKELDIDEELLECYGKYKAKINFYDVSTDKNGKLILVTSINPTPYGEGKTTVSIGLHDGLRSIGKKSVAVLREPSLGPVFGIKGGATGGRYAQIVPMEDINLHFTGDLHAITSANNLISAAIDNHLYFGNELGLDQEKIVFKRCMDMNDRALRDVEVRGGGKVTRKDYFNITAASEIMSILCLSEYLGDLKEKLGSILIGYTYEGKPVYSRDLKIDGALTVLLKDALKPNLVQTLENNPVIVHGGPFANIAHGCNSVIATRLGMKVADYVVTEAGFGADLGAEKFFDIKCRKTGLKPDCVVLVCTIKALKYNAGIGKEDILKENVDAVQRGLPNLMVHLVNLLKYTHNVIVTVNKYDTDTPEEIDIVRQYCKDSNVPFVVSDSYLNGGVGSQVLAKKVSEICDNPNDFQLLYEDNLSIVDKINKVCTEIYHAGKVNFSDVALEKIKMLEALEVGHLPVCISKTQYSISDDPKKLGFPSGFDVTVRDIIPYTGAGFITVLLGDVMTMPGLSRKPNYENIDIDKDGNIVGIF